MAYQVYITEALVCTSRNSNTSDRSYLLFTKDSGMLWASAKSVREERSKHRYALQDFSRVRVSLVRGKSGWRVTGSEALGSLYHAADSREARTLIRNIVRLLRRLLHGETPLPRVYEDCVAALGVSLADTIKLETVFTLRLLHELGYIDPEHSHEEIFDAKTLEEAYTHANDQIVKESTEVILKALAESHL